MRLATTVVSAALLYVFGVACPAHAAGGHKPKTTPPKFTVTLASASVVGGGAVIGTVQIGNYAKPVTVTLSSSNTSAPLAASIPVDSGDPYPFSIDTRLTDVPQTGLITAKSVDGSVPPSHTIITVLPVKLAISLPSPASTVGGPAVAGTIQATGYTGGKFDVMISSDSSSALLTQAPPPAPNATTVTISSADAFPFLISTKAVGQVSLATLTATQLIGSNANTTRTILTIVPPSVASVTVSTSASADNPVTGYVTLNGPAPPQTHIKLEASGNVGLKTTDLAFTDGDDVSPPFAIASSGPTEARNAVVMVKSLTFGGNPAPIPLAASGSRAAAVAVPAQAKQTVTIDTQTPIYLTAPALSSDSVQPDTFVTFTVAADVMGHLTDDPNSRAIAIKQGAWAIGKVIQRRHSHSVFSGGALAVQLQTVEAADGQMLWLQPVPGQTPKAERRHPVSETLVQSRLIDKASAPSTGASAELGPYSGSSVNYLIAVQKRTEAAANVAAAQSRVDALRAVRPADDNLDAVHSQELTEANSALTAAESQLSAANASLEDPIFVQDGTLVVHGHMDTETGWIAAGNSAAVLGLGTYSNSSGNRNIDGLALGLAVASPSFGTLIGGIPATIPAGTVYAAELQQPATISVTNPLSGQ